MNDRVARACMIVALCGSGVGGAAVRVHGIRAYGGADETHLPVVLLNVRSITGGTYASAGDPYVTVEFDVEATNEPQLKLIVVHCSRDWQEDWAEFDDNFMHLQTTDVRGTPAAPQIRTYGYHYAVRCPDPARRLTLDYSGNYKMKIIDGADTIGEARFFAVDPFATVGVRTFNDVDYSISWRPQVQNVEITASFAPEVLPSEILGADCIIDQRTLDPRRIDPGDTSATVHVDDIGPVMRFNLMNVIPGNAYRALDITESAMWPASTTPLALVPRDIIRTGIMLTGDLHGSALLNRVSDREAEYIPIRFRLDAIGKRERDVFLVGAFNNWHPDVAWQMDFDAHERSYVRTVWLKRGVYEYQYVTGLWNDRTHTLAQESWTELESNSWGTVRRYTALLYYRDSRYGGIDRIVGSGRNL